MRYATFNTMREDARRIGADYVLYDIATGYKYRGDLISVYFMCENNEIAHYSINAVCNNLPVEPIFYSRQWGDANIAAYKRLEL